MDISYAITLSMDECTFHIISPHFLPRNQVKICFQLFLQHTLHHFVKIIVFSVFEPMFMKKI